MSNDATRILEEAHGLCRHESRRILGSDRLVDSAEILVRARCNLCGTNLRATYPESVAIEHSRLPDHVKWAYMTGAIPTPPLDWKESP